MQAPASQPSPPRQIAESPWELGGLTLWELVRRSTIAYRRFHIGAHSAQFAFYSLLAFVPMLVLVLAGVTRLPIEGVLDGFLATVAVGMPADADELIRAEVRGIRAQPAFGPILVALLLLLYAGAGMFMSIGTGLDVVYELEERRWFVWSGLQAILLTLGGYLLFLTAVVLLVLGPMATEFVLAHVEPRWIHVALSTGVRLTIACGAILLAASVTYWTIPTIRTRWRLCTPGTVFATTAWLVVTQGFRLWVENFGSYNEIYGALAGVIVLLMWLYLTGLVLLMGGQIDGVIRVAAARNAIADRK